MKRILKEDDDKILDNKKVNSDNVERKPEENCGVNNVTNTEPSKNFDSMVEKELRRQGITMDDLTCDNPRLSLDWQTFRGFTQCSCAAPINSLTRKYHCWNCGLVFCRRCIDYQSSLPGHYSENKVPVCKSCYKKLEKNKQTRT